jgi:hypothetical protein
MENLYGKSVKNVELEVQEIVCKALKWMEPIQDKLL